MSDSRSHAERSRVGDKTLIRTEPGEVDVLQELPQAPAMKRAADRPLDRVEVEALEIVHGLERDEAEDEPGALHDDGRNPSQAEPSQTNEGS